MSSVLMRGCFSHWDSRRDPIEDLHLLSRPYTDILLEAAGQRTGKENEKQRKQERRMFMQGEKAQGKVRGQGERESWERTD